MYDSYFDKKGEYASREVLDRAYALGVASVCGDPDRTAYDDLKRNSPDAYDESIVELAYEEGRASALDIRGRPRTRRSGSNSSNPSSEATIRKRSRGKAGPKESRKYSDGGRTPVRRRGPPGDSICRRFSAGRRVFVSQYMLYRRRNGTRAAFEDRTTMAV